MGRYLIFLLISVIFISCEEIVSVTDISSDQVRVLAPKNEAQLTTSAVNFSWEPVAFADSYKLQVASPNFENTNQILFDSIIVDSISNYRYNLNVTLKPGDYSWRVRASNSGYTTAYNTQKFSVSENSSLLNQNLELLTPDDALVSTSTSINFTWEPIEAASFYRFELSNSETNAMLVSEVLASTSYEYSFESSGNYTWRVRAENETEHTAYVERTLEIDQD